MNKRFLTILAVAAFLLSSGLLFSQTSPQDQQKAQEAYMKAMAVTENHALLKHFIGRWNAAATTWQSPSSKPEMSKGTSEVTSIMGGRFIVEKFKAMMMDQPFEGMRVAGYDNIQKKFVTFWIDSTSTGFLLFNGTYDAAKKTFTDLAKWADPMGGTTNVRMVTRIVSPDEHIQEMYMAMPDGKEFKSMEMRYTRVKGISGGC